MDDIDDDDDYLPRRSDRLGRRRNYHDTSDDEFDLDRIAPRYSPSDRFRTHRRRLRNARGYRGGGFTADHLDSNRADHLDSALPVGGVQGDRTIRRLHKRDRHGRPYIEEVIHEKAPPKEEKKKEAPPPPPPPPPAPKAEAKEAKEEEKKEEKKPEEEKKTMLGKFDVKREAFDTKELKKEKRGKFTAKYKYGRKELPPDASEDDVEDAVEEFYSA